MFDPKYMELWKALNQGVRYHSDGIGWEPDSETLAELLNQLAFQPLVYRIAYFGLLDFAVHHWDDAVQIAALRCLRGATGTKAWEWMLEAISNSSAPVQAAAMGSFWLSAEHQPIRWKHLLFHSDAEIRRIALDLLPPHEGVLDLLATLPFLLSERENWDRLVPLLKLGRGALHRSVWVYLDARRSGVITDDEAREFLSHLPWDTLPSEILEHLGGPRPKRTTLTYFESRWDDIEVLARSASRQDPILDELMALMWPDPGSGKTAVPMGQVLGILRERSSANFADAQLDFQETLAGDCPRGRFWRRLSFAAMTHLERRVETHLQPKLPRLCHTRVVLSIVRVGIERGYFPGAPLALCWALIRGGPKLEGATSIKRPTSSPLESPWPFPPDLPCVWVPEYRPGSDDSEPATGAQFVLRILESFFESLASAPPDDRDLAHKDLGDQVREEIFAAKTASDKIEREWVSQWYGWPLDVQKGLDAYEGSTDREAIKNAFGSALEYGNQDWLRAFVTGAFVAGFRAVPEFHLLRMVSHGLQAPSGPRFSTFGGPDLAVRKLREELLTDIASLSREDHTLQLTVMELPKLRPYDRRVRAVARIFEWGNRMAWSLTGHRFRITMIGGSHYGYTRLNRREIFINPTAVLAGVTDGDAIVRGLIVHELGHHIYNGTEEGLEVCNQAQAEGLAQLLNLVQDEHLERNLRALNPDFGHDLKILNSYIFQRCHRSCSFRELEFLLRQQTLDVLPKLNVTPGSKPGFVDLKNGELLFALEAHTHSFARFLRALLMGLGDRHKDPKVSEALALFKGRFRHYDNHQLLEVTRELRRIFGDEIKLLHSMDFHGIAAGGSADIQNSAPGISQAAVDSAVADQGGNPIQQRQRQSLPSSGSGGQVMNLSGNAQFDLIENIEAMESDPAGYRESATAVANWSRQLSGSLEDLGWENRRVGHLAAGNRLDRRGLGTALIKRDPRILMRRQPHKKTDLFIGVAIDCSGSMSNDNRMDKARQFAVLIAESVRRIDGVDARFFGFTDSILYDAGTDQNCSAHLLEADGGNNDAAALFHLSYLAKRSRRSQRLLVQISDGSPTECSVEALRTLVQRLTREGMHCAQVAVVPIEEVCFPNYIEVLDDDLNHSVGRFGRIVNQLISRAVNS